MPALLSIAGVPTFEIYGDPTGPANGSWNAAQWGGYNSTKNIDFVVEGYGYDWNTFGDQGMESHDIHFVSQLDGVVTILAEPGESAGDAVDVSVFSSLYAQNSGLYYGIDITRSELVEMHSSIGDRALLDVVKRGNQIKSGTASKNEVLPFKVGDTFPVHYRMDVKGTSENMIMGTVLGPTGQASYSLSVTQHRNVTVKLDSESMVPLAASGVHLNSIYGGENVILYATVTAERESSLSADGKVEFYLSRTKTLPVGAKPFKVQVYTMRAGTTETDIGTVGVIPQDLEKDKSYYLIVKVKPTYIGETQGALSDNVDTSLKPLQYLGKPGTYFRGSKFFDASSDLIQRATSGSLPAFMDSKSFVALQEGNKQYSYLDSEGVPTIGVGINLLTVPADQKLQIAKMVKAYYLIHYHEDISSKSTQQVIDMLISQATPSALIKGKFAISLNNGETLFNAAYTAHLNELQTTLTSAVWDILQPTQKTALISLYYNVGADGFSKFTGLIAALKRKDFVAAGFELVDSKRATQIGFSRLQAEFEYLLYPAWQELGHTV